ncbi:MAG: hypothetical protein QOE95_2370, partial [Gaiellaceae bacterium]|nr:hypothetical protein [Gaiellaceae bacterium]
IPLLWNRMTASEHSDMIAQWPGWALSGQPEVAGSGMTAFERERRKAAVRDSLEPYSPAVDASGEARPREGPLERHPASLECLWCSKRELSPGPPLSSISRLPGPGSRLASEHNFIYGLEYCF